MRILLFAAILLCSTVAGAQTIGLHPDFPVVQGTYQLTDDWELTLFKPHNRRFEDGSLVLWRPGLTIWVNIWNNDGRESVADRLSQIKSDIPSEAFDLEESSEGSTVRLTYRLNEPGPDGDIHAYYGFVIGPDSHVQIATYFDSEADVSTAKAVLHSVRSSSL